MEKNKEQVNHPSHYNNYPIEVIDMMVKIWGEQKVIDFCLINAFKYRMRLGIKGNNKVAQDMAKETWYLDKAKELSEVKKPMGNMGLTFTLGYNSGEVFRRMVKDLSGFGHEVDGVRTEQLVKEDHE